MDSSDSSPRKPLSGEAAKTPGDSQEPGAAPAEPVDTGAQEQAGQDRKDGGGYT